MISSNNDNELVTICLSRFSSNDALPLWESGLKLHVKLFHSNEESSFKKNITLSLPPLHCCDGSYAMKELFYDGNLDELVMKFSCHTNLHYVTLNDKSLLRLFEKKLLQAIPSNVDITWNDGFCIFNKQILANNLRKKVFSACQLLDFSHYESDHLSLGKINVKWLRNTNSRISHVIISSGNKEVILKKSNDNTCVLEYNGDISIDWDKISAQMSAVLIGVTSTISYFSLFIVTNEIPRITINSMSEIDDDDIENKTIYCYDHEEVYPINNSALPEVIYSNIKYLFQQLPNCDGRFIPSYTVLHFGNPILTDYEKATYQSLGKVIALSLNAKKIPLGYAIPETLIKSLTLFTENELETLDIDKLSRDTLEKLCIRLHALAPYREFKNSTFEKTLSENSLDFFSLSISERKWFIKKFFPEELKMLCLLDETGDEVLDESVLFEMSDEIKSISYSRVINIYSLFIPAIYEISKSIYISREKIRRLSLEEIEKAGLTHLPIDHDKKDLSIEKQELIFLYHGDDPVIKEKKALLEEFINKCDKEHYIKSLLFFTSNPQGGQITLFHEKIGRLLFISVCEKKVFIENKYYIRKKDEWETSSNPILSPKAREGFLQSIHDSLNWSSGYSKA